MLRTKREIEEIAELIRTVRVREAEKRCRALITTLDDEELREVEADLRAAIKRFQKKKRSSLLTLLDKALGSPKEPVVESPAVVPKSVEESGLFPVESGGAIEDRLEQTLKQLAERHIFQWSTEYRDQLAPLFEQLAAAELERLRHGQPPLAPLVRAQFANHAYLIAGQGYHYTLREGKEDRGIAIAKAFAGFQRFLELPIEFYSGLYTSVTTAQGAVALRRICSAIVGGIVEGYGSVQLDTERGWQVFARTPRTWVHCVGFLTADELADIAENLESGALVEGLKEVVLPVVGAVDELVQDRPLSCTALPVLSQFESDSWRLTISLEGARATGARLVEIHCYLDPTRVHLGAIEEAASRGVSLVAARLSPDVADWVESRDHFRQLVMNVGRARTDASRDKQRAKDVLGLVIATEYGTLTTDAPLSYNFARDFPLHNPFLKHYFHVFRPSVRALLGRFDRRNGVRLWCSVRRSGKTTACFDLGTTTGRSTVVTQTCDRTAQEEQSDLFYKMVCDALTARDQIPDTFFSHAVDRCSPPRRPNEIRFVFVLDEYETFFERLRLAVQRDPELRYMVVQPLLNQMVAFTRDNLLVFIGQRPDAHYILMDQNQLSAYIEQDSFPLFEHRKEWSEFNELLRKVASERVPFEAAFADAVYAETAGHPFLTVKLMIDYFDWLIEQKRSMRALRLTAEDFNRFRSEWLTPRRLGTAQSYQFFAQAISEALGAVGRNDTPWLHAVYSVVRQLSLDHPDRFRCTREEFDAMVHKLEIDEKFGYSPDRLLGTAEQANFLGFSDTEVWVRIPLLGRVASTARPKLSW